MTTPLRVIQWISVGGSGAGPRNEHPAYASGWGATAVQPWAQGVFIRAISGSSTTGGSSVGKDWLGQPVIAEVDGKPGALQILIDTFAAHWGPIAARIPVYVQDGSVLESDNSMTQAQAYTKYFAPFAVPGVRRVFDSASALERTGRTWRLLRYAWSYRGQKSIIESNPPYVPQGWILEEKCVEGVQADYGTWRDRIAWDWITPYDLRQRGIAGYCSCVADNKAERIEQAKWAIAHGLSPLVQGFDMTTADVSPALALVGSVPDGG